MAIDLKELAGAPLTDLEKKLADGGALTTQELSALLLNVIGRMNQLHEAQCQLLTGFEEHQKVLSQGVGPLTLQNRTDIERIDKAVRALAKVMIRVSLHTGAMPEELREAAEQRIASQPGAPS
jgi:hypothetical protein